MVREAQARGTARRGACAALRHGSLALRHDRLALRHGRLGGHDTATARAWACLRAPGRAGWSVCVHTVHLTSFWTQYCFRVTVHEHCSPNFFEKKMMNEIKFLKKIKSNQIK